MQPADQTPYSPIPGLIVWSIYDAMSRVPLWSTMISHDGFNLVIDPCGPPESLPMRPDAILITSENHERDTSVWGQVHGCPLLASSETQSILGLNALPPVDVLPADWKVSPVEGAARGEIALWVPALRHLAFGDALIHLEGYGFDFLPDKYCSDQVSMRRCLADLASLAPKTMSFAHGEPIIENAAERLAERVSIS